MAETNNQENSLVKAMREMKAGNDNALKTAFVKELLKTRLFVPVNITPEPENGTIKPGSIVSYMSLRENSTERKLLLTFTSREEYDKFSTGGLSSHIVIHNYSEVKTLVAKKGFNGFIIDPSGENVAVSSNLIETIDKITLPLQVKNEKVHITDGRSALSPASGETAPEELKETLSEYLKTQDNINKCYLMETLRDNETKPTLVAVLDFDGNIQSAFNGVAAALRKHLAPGTSLGMMSISDNIAAQAVIGVEPFYEK